MGDALQGALAGSMPAHWSHWLVSHQMLCQSLQVSPLKVTCFAAGKQEKENKSSVCFAIS